MGGPTIEVVVGRSQAPDKDGKFPAPDRQALALIDTGATDSCIAQGFAEELQLPIVDVRMVGSAGGRRPHNVYLGTLVVPALAAQFRGGLLGVDLSITGPIQHRVILGRDFLASVVLVYNGAAGHVTICT